ncbi:unnamed protein product [Penicillium nalgiovense]|nr:unnamed protein product [Penicillium nalgiovense]
MARGNTKQSKVYYKGQTEDFVIFAADVNAAQNWKKDHSIPLAQVIDGWKIFTSHQYVPILFYPPVFSEVRLYYACQFVGNESPMGLTQSNLLMKHYNSTRHGPQGIHNEASRAILEHEFGTSNEREVISHILEKGEIQENVVRNNLFLHYSRVPSIHPLLINY